MMASLMMPGWRQPRSNCRSLQRCLVNYMEVEELLVENKKVKGAVVYDHLSKETLTIRAHSVINATGVFADAVINMDNPDAETLLTPSQGCML